MAYSSIVKPSVYFNNKLWTGNGNSSHAQTGVGFQPDLVWLKARSESEYHFLFDAIRGATKGISSDLTAAEATYAQGLKSFDSDGFTIGTSNGMNRSGTTYASWNWKANGQGSANTDGSINTTYTSVNTTAGFSISKYTGTGNAGTVGHGLGVAPKMIIIKNISQTTDWVLGHQELDASAPWTKYLKLNDTSAVLDSPVFNDTAPTNSVFSVGADGKTSSGAGSHVAYCFAEKKGYSKFGSYKGNGNADGTFIYTGFKPAFVIVKIAEHTGNWQLFDNKRVGYNQDNHVLRPNLNNAECTSCVEIDILSNGFKLRNTDGDGNTVNNKYLYMAFAEEPLVANVGASIPATAR